MNLRFFRYPLQDTILPALKVSFLSGPADHSAPPGPLLTVPSCLWRCSSLALDVLDHAFLSLPEKNSKLGCRVLFLEVSLLYSS